MTAELSPTPLRPEIFSFTPKLEVVSTKRIGKEIHLVLKNSGGKMKGRNAYEIQFEVPGRMETIYGIIPQIRNGEETKITFTCPASTCRVNIPTLFSQNISFAPQSLREIAPMPPSLIGIRVDQRIDNSLNIQFTNHGESMLTPKKYFVAFRVNTQFTTPVEIKLNKNGQSQLEIPPILGDEKDTVRIINERGDIVYEHIAFVKPDMKLSAPEDRDGIVHLFVTNHGGSQTEKSLVMITPLINERAEHDYSETFSLRLKHGETKELIFPRTSNAYRVDSPSFARQTITLPKKTVEKPIVEEKPVLKPAFTYSEPQITTSSEISNDALTKITIEVLNVGGPITDSLLGGWSVFDKDHKIVCQGNVGKLNMGEKATISFPLTADNKNAIEYYIGIYGTLPQKIVIPAANK